MAQNEPGRQHAAAYEFHVFRLEIPEQLLLRDGRPLPLTPRAFDLLAYFVQHPQRLLEKTTLLRDVWRDAIVEEANLAFQVSVLRRVLDDGRSDDSLIQTVPTKGYRFVSPVTVIPSSVPHGRSVAGPIDAAPAESVASARWVRTAAWVAVLLVIAATVVIVTSFRRWAAAQLEPEAMLTRLTALPAGVQVDMARISNNGRFVAWSEPEGLRVLVIDS